MYASASDHSAPRSGGVQMTAELRRILAMPRRTWTEAEADEMAMALTGILRTGHGTMRLRPVQAVALAEAGMVGGLFGAIGVGHGKTLISLLAPNVMGSSRPLLLVPAKLVEKTKREARQLAQHWRLPAFVRVESYELLGRTQAAELLVRYQPDLIICDESHRLKSPKAAVTRRVMRYLGEHSECRLVAMSGTITTRSLRDYAHLLARSVPESPLPRKWGEVEEWSDAIDEKPRAESRLGVGALAQLCNDEERALDDELQGVRRAYRRRLTDTSGVITTEASACDASIRITAMLAYMGPATDEAFKALRADWALPDGEPMADGMTLWRHARELALGFYYRWDPAPPKPWLEARKAWAAECRHILGHNRRHLDSELQVAQAVTAGHYPEALPALHAWQLVRDSFRPNTVPVWLDDGAVRAAAAWASRGPGIIWTEHTAFAEGLAQCAGIDYYGAEGVNSRGEPIEAADPARPLIASIASNHEGRNLQTWNRCLIASMPPNGRMMEQLLGRTHRQGQTADEVTWEVLVTCREHVDAFRRAQADARFIEDSTGQKQKLLFADVDFNVEENQR